jgi:arylsulfatase A-like enzyme
VLLFRLNRRFKQYTELKDIRANAEERSAWGRLVIRLTTPPIANGQTMQHLDRRTFLKATAATVAMSGFTDLIAAPQVKKPNVLFLFSDDQQADTIRALGNSHIQTPNIDRLVAMGTTFTNAHIMGSSSPAVCSPSRASLMTGRTLWNLENQGLWGFEISEKYKTMPEVFRAAGYETFGTGKNEPGLKGGSFKRGFTKGEKILFAGNSNHQRIRLYDLKADGTYERQVIKDKHSSEVYADATMDFISEHAASEKPFFAYVSFQAPHDPWQAPQRYLDMYKPENLPVPEAFMPKHPFDNGELKIRDERKAPFPRTKEKLQQILAKYYAMITHMDAQIGRILETLEKTGQLDNTIIVFGSDNGMAVGRHGLLGKQSVYEHSTQVPLIVAGPGIPENQKRDQLCYLYDIVPTLFDLAGLKTPQTVQYKSLADVLKNKDAAHRDHLYSAYMAYQRAVRDDRYKLIEYCVNNQRHTQLFDLQNDPHELNNLAGDPQHADLLARLRKLLETERVRLNDGDTGFEFTTKQGQTFWSTYQSVKESATP